MKFSEIFSIIGLGLGGALAVSYYAKNYLGVQETNSFSKIKSASLGVRG